MQWPYGNLFPVAKIISILWRIVFVRENKFEHSARDKLSKPGRYISNKPRLRNIQLSQQKAGQSLNHFERIGREIDNFRLPGLPSLKDIRAHFDQTLEREEKKRRLLVETRASVRFPIAGLCNSDCAAPRAVGKRAKGSNSGTRQCVGQRTQRRASADCQRAHGA